MQLDTLGRRQRGKPSPLGKNLKVTDGDVDMLLALQDHGILPTNYLAKFRGTSVDYTRDRIGNLLHEKVAKYGHLIEFPYGWDNTKFSLSNFYQVRLSDSGKKWLSDNGYTQDVIRPTGGYIHQLLMSTFTASVELTARKKGISYIPGHVILERAGTPRQKTYRTPVWTEGKDKLIPDQLFALRYPDQTYEGFVVEVDMGGEQNSDTPKSRKRKTFDDTFRKYKRYIGGKAYKDHLGLECEVKVLNVEARLGTMHNHIGSISSCDFMLFKYLEGFGPSFRTPSVMSGVLEDDWLRAGRAGYNLGE